MSAIDSTSEVAIKETVENAISDYHSSILPYLGGMPSIVANKFSKSDLMSYDEKLVGCAPDGKPLYQKTVEVTMGQVGWSSANHNVSNIGFRQIVDCIIIKSSDSTYWSFGYRDNTSHTMGVVKSNTVEIYSGTADFTSAIVTIQYTKTTDSAIAIGNDTDYSTTEKIVGTDTDGKYVYQKTISNNNLTNDDWNILDTIPNIYKLKFIEGSITDTDGSIWNMFGYRNSEVYFETVKFGNDIKVFVSSANVFVGGKAELTIQYTKTS